jgi:hypothetical protein
MAPPPRPNPQEVSPSRKICSSHEPDRQPSPTPQAPSQLRQAWTWSAWRRRRAARLVQQPPGLPACNRTIVRQPARVVQRSELQQIPCKQRSGRPLQWERRRAPPGGWQWGQEKWPGLVRPIQQAAAARTFLVRVASVRRGKNVGCPQLCLINSWYIRLLRKILRGTAGSYQAL